MEGIVESIRVAGAPFGLNLIAAISLPRYIDEVKPAPSPAIDQRLRSVIVIANGGGTFWRAFAAYRDDHPGWERRQNPLDDFTRAVVEEAIVSMVRATGIECTSVYPFDSGPATLNFMALGKASGLAGPSIIGVVINPVYGPWIAFRAALLVDIELNAPGDAVGFDPCRGCVPRSCIAACPADTISSPSGWDIPRCLEYRVESEAVCAPRCHARTACVIGPEHRYPDDALAYHQMRALRAMRPYYDAHRRGR